MIVIDLGCHAHERYDSIGVLIAKYHPAVLYGYDPHPDTKAGVAYRRGTMVVIVRAAAWTRNGQVSLELAGSGSHVSSRGPRVRCFNLCQWLKQLPKREPVILKMDVEGAEHQLIKELVRTRMDKRLTLLLLERHGAGLIPTLSCPVEKWWM